MRQRGSRLAAGIAAIAAISAIAASAAPASPAAAAVQTARAAAPQTLSHGLFKDVRITRPEGEPKRVVLLLAAGGADGAAAAAATADALTGAGAMVARIDTAPFLARLAAEGGACSFADGAFENLGHEVEAVFKLRSYLPPVLVGLGESAALAYAVQAQAAAGTFAGAVSLGFCPQLDLKIPLCPGKGLKAVPRGAGSGVVELQPAPVVDPWTVLQAESDPACGARVAQPFVAAAPRGRLLRVPDAAQASVAAWLPALTAAYSSMPLPLTALAAPPPRLADLPIVEVPATSGASPTTRFAVLLSGDGGWAGIDKGVAKALAESGIPVAGFDSLRYFWSARTPQGLADDLDRVIRYYASRWGRPQVMLIGYSQGADVLPFAINRLPAATAARIQSTVLLGLAQKASFEFHVSNWIGTSGDRPVAPEALRLSASTTVCIYGASEKDSLCPALAPVHARALALQGDHHFGGNYDKLAAVILEQSGKP